jgi:hypothetical protein
MNRHQSSNYGGLLFRGRRGLRAQARYATGQEQQRMDASADWIRHQNLYPAAIPTTSLKAVGLLLRLVQSRLYSSENIRYALGL